MRFTYAESMCDVTHFMPLAVAADQHGWHSFTVPDSLIYPAESDTRYPYTDDGNRQFLDGVPMLEPFTLIPALAAVTERLRFTTFVVKLPVRHPVLVAKQAACVAVLSNNRFGFGVGLSPWPEDFAATGTDWKTRGKRMDEMLEIMRGLWTGEYFEYKSAHYDIPRLKINPVPTEKLPILIGGHADPALRRAARAADGWMHAGGGQAADLDATLARLNELRVEYGTDKQPFEIHVISLDGFTVDGCKRLEDKGITDVVVGFRDPYSGVDQPLQQKIDALKGFADNVIAKAGE